MRKTACLCLALALCGLMAGSTAQAETPAEKGRAIAAEMEARDSGFENSEVRVHMILRNRRGGETTRDMQFMTLEEPAVDIGDKTLVIVESPANVAGTALLTHGAILGADDQWIYLPALKRVKRISSANKAGPFMGSEFAYEDMAAQDLEKFDYLWLRDEACPGFEDLTCAVIERRPRYENSGYSKQVVWIDRDAYRVFKTDYHDRKGTLLKTLTLSRYGQYLNRFWRPHEMHMVNHQTGKETTIETGRFNFRADIDTGLFDKNNLDRVK